MILNYIWIAFFLTAFVVACIQLFFFGNTDIFPAIIQSTFESSKTAFEISIGLTGVLSLWMGIMRIGEAGGVINMFSRILSPIFCKLFPDIPKGHPVTGSIFMNLAANMLGLDNAATPLGLKAMEGLQAINPKKDTASNPMIMFLVLNTSGLTLIPISIMVYRAQLGAAQPTDVFVPILLATFFSTLAGIIAVSLYQRINLLNRTILLFLGGISLVIGGIIYFFSTLPPHTNRYLLYYHCECVSVFDYHRIHSGRSKEAHQCIRCVCRGSQGGIFHSGPYHSLSGSHSGGYRGFPHLGMHGLSDCRNRAACQLDGNRQ